MQKVMISYKNEKEIPYKISHKGREYFYKKLYVSKRCAEKWVESHKSVKKRFVIIPATIKGQNIFLIYESEKKGDSKKGSLFLDLTNKRRERRQYSGRSINDKRFIDEEYRYVEKSEGEQRIKKVNRLGNTRLLSFFDPLGTPYWKVYFCCKDKKIMEDLKKYGKLKDELVNIPKFQIIKDSEFYLLKECENGVSKRDSEFLEKKFETKNHTVYRFRFGDNYFVYVHKNKFKSYSSLNDVFTSGTTEIWYWKKSEWLLWDGALKRRILKLPTKYSDLSESHVLLGKIGNTIVGEIFHRLQGEVWSPEGQANNLIRKKGLKHTSMSVGDMIYIKPINQLYIVKGIGWKKIILK